MTIKTAQELFEDFYETVDDRDDEKARLQAVLDALCDGEALDSFFKDPQPLESDFNFGQVAEYWLALSAWEARNALCAEIVEEAYDIAQSKLNELTAM